MSEIPATPDPLSERLREAFETSGDVGVQAVLDAFENFYAYRVQQRRLTLEEAVQSIETALKETALEGSRYARLGAEDDFANYSAARNIKHARKTLRTGGRLSFRTTLGQDLVEALDARLPPRTKGSSRREKSNEEPGESPSKTGHAEEAPIATIDAGDRGRVVHYANRIEWVTEHDTRDGPVTRSWPVIDGHLEVVGRYDIDGDELFCVHEDKESFVSATTLRSRLDAAGKLVDHGKASDALALVLRNETKGKLTRGHSAAGVYSDPSGKLSLDTVPFPRYAEQAATAEAVRKIVGTKGSADSVRAYLLDLPALWEPYEILPVVGLSAISPFALVLRQAKEIVPHLLHVAYQHGLGKTTTATAYTENLFGIPVVAADSIRSAFRIAAAFDAVGCARTFDETEKLDERSWGPELKALAEQSIGAKRGTAALEMITFWSRAVGVLTGQRLPFETPSVLTRLIVVRYDERKLPKRRTQEARRRLKAVLGRLEPIGWHVAAHAVTMFPTARSLLDRLAAVGREIDDAYEGDFEDGRRPVIWATVLVGLEIWSAYAKSLGVEWIPPTVEEFVTSVVVPNEVTTFNVSREPVKVFSAWVDGYIARNRLPNGTIRGADEIWRYDVVEGVSGPILGRWITEPIVAEYNASAEPPLKVEGLNELARQLADEFALPTDTVLSREGKGAKTVWFAVPATVRKAVFLPLDTQTENRRSTGGGSTPKVGKLVSTPHSTSKIDLTNDSSGGKANLPIENGGRLTNLPSSSLDPPCGVVPGTSPSDALGATLIDLVEKGATDDQLRAVLRLQGFDNVGVEANLSKLRPKKPFGLESFDPATSEV